MSKAEKAETTETAVVTTQSTDVISATAKVGRGFENVDFEEITMPRAKLLQSNSPEVADRDYNFRAGDVVHTLLMEKVPAKFIPISIWTSNVLFVPRSEEKKPAFKALLELSDEDMNGMIICKAADGKTGEKYGSCEMCGKHKFKGNEKPICTETINVLAVPLTEEGMLGLPYVLQFSNTSFKHGKKFRDAAFYSSFGGDLFSKVYKIEAIEAAGNGNRWFECKIKPAGLVPEELKGKVEEMYESFAGKLVVVEDSEEEVESVDY
jgi:hypothetical protein